MKMIMAKKKYIYIMAMTKRHQEHDDAVWQNTFLQIRTLELQK